MATGPSRTPWPPSSATACSPAFPSSAIASIEAGGEWIPAFVQHLGDTYKKMPNAFDGDPVEQFKRNVYVSPFHEDDLGEIIDVIGADHVLFGSDWPHPEGLAEPTSYVDHLPKGLPAEDVENIMGGNLARLMKVDAPVGAAS